MSGLPVVIGGTLVADVRVRPFRPLVPGESGGLRAVEEVRLAAGGLVSNMGMALARIGLETVALGRLGDDAVAEVLRAELAASGLRVDRLVRQSHTATSAVLVCVDGDGERTFHVAPGANLLFGLEDLEREWALLRSAQVIVLGYLGELPHLDPHLPRLLSRLRAESTALLVLETAGPQTRTRALLDQCLPMLDVFFPSWNEARDLTGRETPTAALADLARVPGPTILGIKTGAEGSMLWRDHTAVRIPAVTAQVVDATGAGDVFLAGLLAALLDHRDPLIACQVGNLAASLAIGARGGAARIPPLSTLLLRVGVQ